MAGKRRKHRPGAPLQRRVKADRRWQAYVERRGAAQTELDRLARAFDFARSTFSSMSPEISDKYAAAGREYLEQLAQQATADHIRRAGNE